MQPECMIPIRSDVSGKANITLLAYEHMNSQLQTCTYADTRHIHKYDLDHDVQLFLVLSNLG
jgi:hypothetical protein